MLNQTLDDAGGLVHFWPAERWTHEKVPISAGKIINDTLSFALEGGYAFGFNGTGFGICSGLGGSEGLFEVVIDGISAGTGPTTNHTLTFTPFWSCNMSFMEWSLNNTLHDVYVLNQSPNGFLALDYVLVVAQDPHEHQPLPAPVPPHIAPPRFSHTAQTEHGQNHYEEVITGYKAGISVTSAIAGLLALWLITMNFKRKRDRSGVEPPGSSRLAPRESDNTGPPTQHGNFDFEQQVHQGNDAHTVSDSSSDAVPSTPSGSNSSPSTDSQLGPSASHAQLGPATMPGSRSIWGIPHRHAAERFASAASRGGVLVFRRQGDTLAITDQDTSSPSGPAPSYEESVRRSEGDSYTPVGGGRSLYLQRSNPPLRGGHSPLSPSLRAFLQAGPSTRPYDHSQLGQELHPDAPNGSRGPMHGASPPDAVAYSNSTTSLFTTAEHGHSPLVSNMAGSFVPPNSPATAPADSDRNRRHSSSPSSRRYSDPGRDLEYPRGLSDPDGMSLYDPHESVPETEEPQATSAGPSRSNPAIRVSETISEGSPQRQRSPDIDAHSNDDYMLPGPSTFSDSSSSAASVKSSKESDEQATQAA